MKQRSQLSSFVPALVAAPIALGLVAARALGQIRELVALHGYGEIEFTRSTFLLYSHGARDAVVDGVATAVGAVLVAMAVGVMFAARRSNWGPETLVGWVQSSAVRARLIACAAAAALLTLLVIEREKSWVSALDIAFVLGVSGGFAAVIWCLGRYARGELDLHRRATIAASLLCVFLLVIAGTWINRELLAHPRDPETWLYDALLLIVAGVCFVVLRRRARAELAGQPLSMRWHPLSVAAALGAVLTLASLAAPRFESMFAGPMLRAAKPHNVLLIGIDTLRADATSILGPSLRGRDTTPNLRALANRGVAFRNAVSQAPWTMPSFASILTGRYPHEHGAFSLSGSVREREVMLAEVLSEAGYATSGVVSHSYLNEQRGFAQGFGTYDASNALGHRAVTSKDVTDLSIRALEDRGDAPFFHFAHYFDAHYEYMDQADWNWADGYQGWLRGELDFDNLLKNRQLVENVDNEWLIDLYEEEIAHVDREVGRLLEWLETRGLAQDTLVIVVADHGEEFLDHGSYGHTTTLFQEQLHVPLIVAPPAWTSACVVDGVVETRALFGTVLDVLDVDFAKPAREHGLLRRLGPDCVETESANAKAFSIVWLPDAKLEWGKHMRLASHRDGRWKLIRDYTRDKTMLFDIESDPRETRDLAAEQPERVDALGRMLETWAQEQQRRGGEARTISVDAAELKRLKELGYL